MSSAANPVAQRQIPVVTCFVPHLSRGLQFRVSLHSWYEPPVSRGTQATTSPNDSILFEARVFLDGMYAGYDCKEIATSTRRFKAETLALCFSLTTPPEIDKAGDQEYLRFPPFHQEMLTQTWWSAGEDFGRIKVVIAEGFAESHGPPSGFRRLRNIVSFSFQHVPLGMSLFAEETSSISTDRLPAILEDAGIAWPNAGMWQQSSQQLYKSPTQPGDMDASAHAHSPRRRISSHELARNTAATMIAPPMLSQASMPPPARRSMMLTDSDWTSAAPLQDQFSEHRSSWTWGTGVSTSDDSMPDYSHSITPRSSRHPSSNWQDSVNGETTPQQGSQFEELMADLSPAKTSGTQAPPTTRVSSASNTPSTKSSVLELQEIRALSFQNHPRSVAVTARDALPWTIRDPSDISIESRFSEAQPSGGEHARGNIVRPPASIIKGKKEGKSSSSDFLATTSHRKAQAGSMGRRAKSTGIQDGENQSFPIDSKRKRESTDTISHLVAGRVVELDSSPSRKVSKKEGKDGGTTGPDDVGVRAPLGLLENIQ
ncbi:MAG: hypothetical protein LQ352_003271 [Teloschistes flavicans]|nr:MAG: hypothetical protein LQ352_003271 [Teloschistes flavicans]